MFIFLGLFLRWNVCRILNSYVEFDFSTKLEEYQSSEKYNFFDHDEVRRSAANTEYPSRL